MQELFSGLIVLAHRSTLYDMCVSALSNKVYSIIIDLSVDKDVTENGTSDTSQCVVDTVVDTTAGTAAVTADTEMQEHGLLTRRSHVNISLVAGSTVVESEDNTDIIHNLG